jgi:hypothetical protein
MRSAQRQARQCQTEDHKLVVVVNTSVERLSKGHAMSAQEVVITLVGVVKTELKHSHN